MRTIPRKQDFEVSEIYDEKIDKEWKVIDGYLTITTKIGEGGFCKVKKVIKSTKDGDVEMAVKIFNK